MSSISVCVNVAVRALDNVSVARFGAGHSVRSGVAERVWNHRLVDGALGPAAGDQANQHKNGTKLKKLIKVEQ